MTCPLSARLKHSCVCVLAAELLGTSVVESYTRLRTLGCEANTRTQTHRTASSPSHCVAHKVVLRRRASTTSASEHVVEQRIRTRVACTIFPLVGDADADVVMCVSVSVCTCVHAWGNTLENGSNSSSIRQYENPFFTLFLVGWLVGADSHANSTHTYTHTAIRTCVDRNSRQTLPHARTHSSRGYKSSSA